MALGQLPPGTDVLDVLKRTLKAEDNEYAQRCFASAFAGLGARAQPALPDLEKYQSRADKRVAQDFEQAIKIIRDARVKPLSRAQKDSEQTIQQEIRAFCRQRAS